MKRFSWVQSLRGIAAMLVLLFHARPHWETVTWLIPLSAVTKWGAAGVDIFITLSGFVIGHSIFSSAHKEYLPASDFLARRALRIYSGYWLVLPFVIIGTLYLFPGTTFPLGKAFRSIFLLYPYYLDAWMPVAWTLSFELYFYAWVALTLWLKPKNLLSWILLLLTFLVVWNYGWMKFSPTLTYEARQPTRFIFPAFGIEFLLGTLLAFDFSHRQKFNAYGLVGLFLTCAGVALGTFSYDAFHFELLRALSFGIASCGLIMLCLWLECERKWAPPRILRLVGDASYSLYLLHFFLLDASSLLRAWLNVHNPALLTPFTLATPVLIIMFSIAWYRFLEKPVYRYLRDRVHV